MNRQFKFRAWNGTEFLDSEYWKITNSGIENYYDENQELIIQQYTGLHDKNGNEICEGDLIKYANEPEEIVINQVVFDCKSGHFGTYRGAGFRAALLFPNAPIAEIVGNIFETPELLK